MLHFLLFIITIILLCILDIPGKSLSCGMCLIIFSTAKEYSMGTTQPIRNKDELAAFRMYYKDIHPNRRNYCLIVMGLNTALRISDLLKLKWDNVYNFEHHVFRSHFLINEQKTVRELQSYFGFEEPRAIYKWQKGESLPTVDNLYALGVLFEVPIDQILVPVIKLHIVSEQQAESCCSHHFLPGYFGYGERPMQLPPFAPSALPAA